jgi:hypothetical protein
MVVQKIKEQSPSLVLTAVLVVGAALWLHHEDAQTQRRLVEPLRAQNEALRAAADDNHRELVSTSELLRNAVARRDSELFRPDEEMQKLNSQRMDALADAIARKVQPVAVAAPKSPEEIGRAEDRQVERIASRMADKLKPMLSTVGSDNHLATDDTVRREFARNQELTADLQQTQAAAQDALKLSHELSILYLDSFRDQGMIKRALTFPGYMVSDLFSLSIISSNERKRAERNVSAKLDAIEKRIDEIQAQALVTKS